MGFLCGRDRTCGNKVNYKCQATAERAAIAMGKKRGKEFDCYNCYFCKGWHIGGAQHLTIGIALRIILFWFLVRTATEIKYETVDDDELKQQ
jgi:hypothetical protein